MLVVSAMQDRSTVVRKKRIHSNFHQMNLSLPLKRQKEIEKSLIVRKINNFEYGRRIDQQEKAAYAKYVKLISSLLSWPSIQRFKAKSMLLRLQVLPFQLKDQRTKKIVGN